MFWQLLTTGFLGSLHCVGMCGGFVLALDRPGARPWRRVGYQALFHLGKTGTYVFLGGLVGLAGAALVRAPWFTAAQTVLSVVAGCLMVLAGLQIMGLLKELPVGGLFGEGSLYDRMVRSALNLKGPVAPLAMGSLTGFLPCPLVYAFLAFAAATGNIFPAMGTMAILGLASMPALVLVALTGASLSPVLRSRLIRVGGAVVVVLGLVTVLRGAFPELIHFGGHEDRAGHEHHHGS